jgi:hypothetical protein
MAIPQSLNSPPQSLSPSHLFVHFEGILIISAPTPREELDDLVLDEEEESLHAAHDEAFEAPETAEGDGDLVRLVVLRIP